MTQSIGPYRLTVSIILIISLNIVFAQPSIFNVFTTSVENGLSHNDVRKVFQDKRGFIWLGTYDGLCRYDGSSFKTYLSIASDTSSISHNTVNDIWEDSSGNLWIATQNGLNRFNIKTESFLRIYISTSTPQTLPFEISQILPDSKANLWLATSNFGLCYYDRIKNKIFQFLPRHKSDEIQEHLKNFGVSGLCFDTSNSSKIWLACREGLFSFDIKNQTFRNYFYQNKFLTDIIQTEANQLWMSSWEGGLIGYDVINNKKINIGKNDIVSNILRKSDHELWIADMINGIGIFDLKTLKVRYIKPQAQIPLSVSIKSLSNISKTGELIWFTEGVATPLFKGVETFDPSLNNFQLFPVNPIATFKMLEVFPDAFAFSKTTDKSYMSAWLGDGLYIMNQEDQVEQIIRFKNKDVLNVKIDQFEHVWASSGQTLLKLNKENNILQEYNTSISKKLLSNILVLHDDPDGYLWVGDINGNLIRIDSRTNSSTHFKLPAEKKVSQNINPSILCMLNDQHGNLWIGTGNGLYVMDKQKESFRRFVHLPHDTSTLVQNQISKMAIDSKGQIWICNQMDGLQVFDTKTGQKVNHFTKQSGLPSDRIYNLIIDKNEDIWMIHPFGISRYTPDTRQILTYELKDGLPLARTDMEITHRPDGYIYFSAYNAFYRFHPDSLFTPQPAPLTFTSFKIFEKEVTFDTVVDFQEIIQLHHDENFITIGFKALNQYKGHNVNYTWQLEGVDDDWTIPTSSRTTASYSNLSPDTYTFRVKAVMEGSQINPVERILKIVITPAWWQTIWLKSCSQLYWEAHYINFILGAYLRFEGKKILKKSWQNLNCRHFVYR